MAETGKASGKDGPPPDERAETAGRDSERRFQALIAGIPQLVWTAVDDGYWTWVSPQWTAYTGQSAAASHGWGWLDAVHPDDRERVRAIWSGAMGRGGFEAEYRLYHAAEDRCRWFQTRAAPVRDEGGAIVEWLGTSTDVDDLRELQVRQQTLVSELQHRVRNILTVIRSVFARTFESDVPIEERIDHFRGRLDSLARTQVILTQRSTGLVDLEEMIRDELLNVGAQEGPTLAIAGPDVELQAVIAESLGLALHELTTNSIKYGALRRRDATLDIHWEINLGDGGRTDLALTWSEQGVPAVAIDPVHSGFGRELIERALPYRLGAETQLDFRGGGVRCFISIPLPGPGPKGATAGA